MNTRTTKKAVQGDRTQDFVTVVIAGQTFGIPIEQVHDVFSPQAITRVPLTLPEIAGVLNLRGRIVTAIDVRSRLGLGPREKGASCMAVGIEHKGEAYGLVIDKVGEVLSLKESEFEANPANLDVRWCSVSNGVYRLDGALLVVLNVERLLEFGRLAA